MYCYKFLTWIALFAPFIGFAQVPPNAGHVTTYVEYIDPEYWYWMSGYGPKTAAPAESVDYYNSLFKGVDPYGSAINIHPDMVTGLINGYVGVWRADNEIRWVDSAGQPASRVYQNTFTISLNYKCPDVIDGRGAWQMVSASSTDGSGNLTVLCQRTVSLPTESPIKMPVVQNACTRDPASAQSGLLTPNPILVPTGQKLRIETDYTGSGPQPLMLTRGYLNTNVFAGGMGSSWWHNHAGSITFSVWPNAAINRLAVASQIAPAPTEQIAYGLNHRVLVTLPSGSVRSFVLNNTTWTAQGNLDTFKSVGSGFSYQAVDDDTVYYFNASGQMVSIVQPNGWAMNYSYSGAGLLTSVTNQFGQNLGFVYDGNGALIQVTTPDGNTISYGYDALQNLAQVTYPDGSTRGFLYENSAFPTALTGISVNGSRIATYAYNSAGKPISTVGVNGVDSYQVYYGYDVGHVWDTITDPLGITRSYSYDTTYGRTAVLWANAPSNVPGDAFYRAQDPNTGLINAEMDYNGNNKLYSWDTNRFLLLNTKETPRSAINTAIRTSSTTWHPNYRLALQEAQPGTLTSYVYNGQPDPFNGGGIASCAPASALNAAGAPIPVLCKKVVQATTDIDGAAGVNAVLNPIVPNRVWQWTYNANAQALTSTDPRGNALSYTYNGLGNLTTVTNALGQTTQFLAYDGNGNPLQTSDPNGVVTSYTYDNRQRVTSVSVGGQTTGYAYTPFGKLSTVNSPDGSTVILSYDANLRLTGMTDSLGNSHTYTLDNAGNRIAEQVADPSGNLTRQIGRLLDGLGRVQQVTGME